MVFQSHYKDLLRGLQAWGKFCQYLGPGPYHWSDKRGTHECVRASRYSTIVQGLKGQQYGEEAK